MVSLTREDIMINKNDCHNLFNSGIYQDILLDKDAVYLIEKHILHNTPFYFQHNSDLFFEIKKCISKKYDIPITNIYLTGSGQVGFSLNPKNNYRDFIFEENSLCDKPSDLDFAIISEKLFNKVWDEICDYRLSDFPYDDKNRRSYYDFENYLFKGWIRPDKFPFDFQMKKDWFEFFNSLNPLVNRKVSCGIFRNETSFLKQYKRSINELIRIIQMEKVNNENELDT